MAGNMVVSLTLLAVVNAVDMICRPRMAVMWYFGHCFWRVSTKSLSFLLGLVAASYPVVSAPLLSAPSGPAACPAAMMQRRAVPARIRSSQSFGMV